MDRCVWMEKTFANQVLLHSMADIPIPRTACVESTPLALIFVSWVLKIEIHMTIYKHAGV